MHGSGRFCWDGFLGGRFSTHLTRLASSAVIKSGVSVTVFRSLFFFILFPLFGCASCQIVVGCSVNVSDVDVKELQESVVLQSSMPGLLGYIVDLSDGTRWLYRIRQVHRRGFYDLQCFGVSSSPSDSDEAIIDEPVQEPVEVDVR